MLVKNYYVNKYVHNFEKGVFTTDEKSVSFVLAVRTLVEQIVELDCSSKRKIITKSVFYMNEPAEFVKTAYSVPPQLNKVDKYLSPQTDGNGLTKKIVYAAKLNTLALI